MNKTASIALFALLLVPISAFADSQTHSINDMWSVKIAHVGDMITITNNDKVVHSITGSDNRGENVDWTLAPGENTTLSFLFPIDFSFYDKYHQGLYGTIYTFEPSVDLTSLNVYNHTSENDLFVRPNYVIVTPMGANVTTTGNDTNTPFHSQNQTAQETQTLGGPSFGISNATQPTLTFETSNATQTPTPVNDSQTIANLKDIITHLKSQLDSANNQTSYWQQQAQYWQSVAMKFILP